MLILVIILPGLFSSVDSGLFFVPVCILGYEPDGSGGCEPCDKDWFREELSAPSCTACATLDAAFITLTTGSNSSSLCGEFSESGKGKTVFYVPQSYVWPGQVAL